MCGSIPYLLQELKVENIIIGKQFENCDNYQQFLKIVKQKKIRVHIVEIGQRINIEKDLYFDILWPSSINVISENSINNNSLVCKMIYKDTSILFTGDIEEIAENQILEKYKNSEILKSDILKVGHHGSKTSTIPKFLEKVNPRIALIGVGENNKFGHPSNEVIQRLKDIGVKIYRTDEMGEISICVDNKGEVKMKK